MSSAAASARAAAAPAEPVLDARARLSAALEHSRTTAQRLGEITAASDRAAKKRRLEGEALRSLGDAMISDGRAREAGVTQGRLSGVPSAGVWEAQAGTLLRTLADVEADRTTAVAQEFTAPLAALGAVHADSTEAARHLQKTRRTCEKTHDKHARAFAAARPNLSRIEELAEMSAALDDTVATLETETAARVEQGNRRVAIEALVRTVNTVPLHEEFFLRGLHELQEMRPTIDAMRAWMAQAQASEAGHESARDSGAPAPKEQRETPVAPGSEGDGIEE